MNKPARNRLPASVRFLLTLIILGCGYPVADISSAVQAPGGKPCQVIVEEDPDAPARLSVKRATCRNRDSWVVLPLNNVSPNKIVGFEIANTRDYENRKGFKSYSTRTGMVIKPGEASDVILSGGLGDWYTDANLGVLERDVYRITWVKFKDGSQWGQQAKQLHWKYNLVLRDDDEAFTAAFGRDLTSFSIASCSEYGFAAPTGLNVSKDGCTTRLSFDFPWRGNFSYRPRKNTGEIVAIKAGDVLRGEFVLDSCGKTATGTLRNITQDIVIMELSDTDTLDNSREICSVM